MGQRVKGTREHVVIGLRRSDFEIGNYLSASQDLSHGRYDAINCMTFRHDVNTASCLS